jgi:SagB-type dehydrogenase family enzyme
MDKPNELIRLPAPSLKGTLSLEEVFLKRRSVRDYKEGPLTESELSQLLWAAQGITDKAEEKRTSPSAGHTYPLEIYVVAGKVDNLKSGIYKYLPESHSVSGIISGDRRKDLLDFIGQDKISIAPIYFLITCIAERTIARYGERANRYVYMEAGHTAENIYLQATALNLGTVVLGKFDDDKIRAFMNLGEDETPLYIMPVGRL